MHMFRILYRQLYWEHLTLLLLPPPIALQPSRPFVLLTPCFIVPPFISRGDPRQTAWETSVSEGRKYGRESDFHVIAGFFNMPQSCDMRQTTLHPLRRKACWGFLRPKNPTASAGFEPANLGTRGQLHLPLNRTANPLHLHTVPTTHWGICQIVVPASLFPVDISPWQVLPAIQSKLFPTSHHLEICVRQNFTSVLKTDDNRRVTNSPDIIVVSIPHYTPCEHMVCLNLVHNV
jgi:hypothetical protein